MVLPDERADETHVEASEKQQAAVAAAPAAFSGVCSVRTYAALMSS